MSTSWQMLVSIEKKWKRMDSDFPFSFFYVIIIISLDYVFYWSIYIGGDFKAEITSFRPIHMYICVNHVWSTLFIHLNILTSFDYSCLHFNIEHDLYLTHFKSRLKLLWLLLLILWIHFNDYHLEMKRHFYYY